MVLSLLAENQIFWSIFLALVLAQGLKIFLLITRHRQRFHPADLFVTGGMPSSHTALVTSLVLIEYLTQGFSNLFFVTFVFAVIVIRDALGVRRTAGEEGHMLNEIIRRTKLHLPALHYSLGHTPTQVVAGAVIGLLSAVIAYLFV